MTHTDLLSIMPITEHERKIAGKTISAELHQRQLAILRRLARYLALHNLRGCTSMAEVRAYLESKGLRFRAGNWCGSVFNTPDWEPTGRWVETTHRGSHNRKVQEWRLKEDTQ